MTPFSSSAEADICSLSLLSVAQAFSPIISASLVLSPVGWRFIFWFQMIINGTVFISMLFILQETRGTVLLSRRARRLTKETGKLHRCRADDERSSFGVMLSTSLTRPFLYLTTEPIVCAFSLWVAVAWGLIYLSLPSVPIAFGLAYGYSEQQSTLVLLGIAVGGIIGWLANFHQERLYKRAASRSPSGKPPPEARLYYACVGALLYPGGLYMYAWGTRAGVSPVVGIIGFVIFNAGVYSIYTAVFSYVSGGQRRYFFDVFTDWIFLDSLRTFMSGRRAVRWLHKAGYATFSRLSSLCSVRSW